jgi:transglutaminase-like putative cysteine protease
MNGESLADRHAVMAVLCGLLISAAPLISRLSPWVVGCFVGMWLLRVWLHWRDAPLPRRSLLLLALAIPLALMLKTPQSVLGREGGVSVLMVLSAFKLLETESLRDWRILLALAFFVAVTPLLFDQSPLAALWLLLTLALLTMALAQLAGQSWRSSVRQTGLSFALGLPLALVLFVVMPRLPGPLWNLPQRDDSASSGLSPVMSPGSISRLILSGEPAFSAVFVGRPPRTSALYWRMLVLDSFDGQSWRNGGRIEADFNTTAVGGTPVHYVLTAKPQQGRLPALDLPQVLPEGVEAQAGLLFGVSGPQQNVRRLEAVSVVGSHLSELLGAARRNWYLQLPPGNSQARELAEQWRRNAHSEQDWVKLALGYYRQNQFRYTLTPPPLQGDIVDQFLFSTRQGFCEHYAASLAFLARAAGIPSRVVVGYQGGDYNPIGNFWQIRSSDAHAWVELWFADEQVWQRVDPTAAAIPGRVDSGVENALPGTRARLPWGGGEVPAWMISLQERWRAAQFQWQQWVIGYDAERQRNLFSWLGLGERVNVAAVLRALLAGGLLAGLPLPFWLWRLRRVQDPLQDGWLHLRQRLQRAGVPVAASDGPLDFLDKARNLPPEQRQTLKGLVKQYIDLRYREKEGGGQAVSEWRRRVRRFRP